MRARLWTAQALSLTTSLLLSQVLVGRPSNGAPAQPVRRPVTAAVEAAEAASVARTGGRRVEVLDQRSETGQTFANPDGSFTAEEHLRPQRVRRADGTWTPVDPTLHRNGDGTISPAATTVAMTFSGGGQAPMATMAAQGRTMSLSWPAPLPPPVLDGNVATYPEILPGVDLRIVADVDRFTHIFVIKTPAAAASAAVRRLTVNTAFSGVNLRPEASGALEAVDANGNPVFRGAAPLMWDSRDKKLAEQGIVTDPRQAKVGTQLQAGKLVLQPDTAMLDDRQAVYPLYVDPEWSFVTGTRSHWTVVRASEPTTSFFDRTSIASSDGSYGMMRAGFNDFEGPSYKDRSMWQMNISAVKYTHINSAKFVLTHQWSGAGCSDGTKRWTDLHHLNSTFSSSTTWNTSWNSGGSGWGATLSSSSAIRRYGYSCGPQQVEFPVTGQVAAEAAAGSSYLWVGLRARSEADKYSWKRYKNDAFVSIQYNRLPNAPAPIAGAATDGKACATGVTRPWVTTATPILAARQSDSDTGQSTLTTTYYWWPVGGSRIDDANHRVAYTGANNATASPAIPSGLLADGSAYVWQARTWDGIDNGQWSAVCEFNADLSPPNDPGAVSAGFYNPGVATGGPGIADTFTFNPPAAKASEVTGYAYTIDDGMNPAAGVQVNTVDPTTFAGAATIAPTHDGTTTLRVWTKDRAGRYSANASTFTLLVSSGGLAANYTFEGATPTADTTGHANTLSLSASGASIVDGRTSAASAPNKALSLTGGGYAETTASPVKTAANNVPVDVRTDASFTVSAWVRITSAGAVDQTAAAINGTNTAAFMLGFGAENKWVFRMAESDAVVPILRTVVSNAAPTVNKWTHLTGTYDATTKTLRLYVGGVQQTATATLTTGFNATRKLSIGSQQWNGAAHGKALTGDLDDVSFYNTVISAAEIQRLAIPRKPVMTVLTPMPATFGSPVQVKFDSLGDANITAYKYSLDSLILAQTGAASGSAYTATFSNPSIGTRTVRVKAQDANGLLSDLTSITFTVVNVSASVAGVIADAAGNPIQAATVSLNPGGLTTTSAADGSYSFSGFAAGTYTVSAEAGSRCAVMGNTDVAINGPAVVNLTLISEVRDAFGYVCSDGAATFTSATTLLPISGDEAITQVALPFTAPFYGQSLTSVWVDVNGVVFASAQPRSHATDAAALPNRTAPNNVIAPFWTDLEIDAGSGVYTATTGSAPNRRFVIEWRNVFPHGDPTQRLSLEAVLGENGAITLGYTGIDTPVEAGQNAVVGIENQWGSAGMTYAANESVLTSGATVSYAYPAAPTPLPATSLTGTVTAGGAVAAGMVVDLDPFGLSTTTDATGGYRFDGLPDGVYHVTAQQCAEAAAADVTIAGGSTVQNLTLANAADGFGYNCGVASGQWMPGQTVVPGLTGDDNVGQVNLPFTVPFYGAGYSSVWVDTNGLAYFQATPSTGIVKPIPSTDPTGFVAPFWDDLTIGGTGGVYTATTGTAPHRQFVIEWRDVSFYNEPTNTVSFEVVLGEDGTVSFNYLGLLNDRGRGSAATVGIESPAGAPFTSFSNQQATLLDGEAITFTYPATAGTATLSGAVTVGGATPAVPLTVTLNPGNLTATTDTLGRYQFTGLLPGTYTATAFHCGRAASSPATPITTDVTIATLAVAAATGSSGNYGCAESTTAFLSGDTQVALSGDDTGVAMATPFPVSWLGSTTSTVWVSTNGAVYAAQPSTWDVGIAQAFPSAVAPNGIVAPFWDDLVMGTGSGLYTKTIGAAPNRQFVLEWRNVTFFNDATPVTFEVVFSENGQITFNYTGLSTVRTKGSNAYAGMENATGTTGFGYSARQPVFVSGRAATFTPVP